MLVWTVPMVFILAIRGVFGRPFCEMGTPDCLPDGDPFATAVARVAAAVAVLLVGVVAIVFLDGLIQGTRRGRYGTPPSWIRIAIVVVGLAAWLLVSAVVTLVFSVSWSYECRGPDCWEEATRYQLRKAFVGILTGTLVLVGGWSVVAAIAAVGVRRPTPYDVPS